MEPLLDRLARWFERERPGLARPAAPPGGDDPRPPDPLRAWFARVDPLARSAPDGAAGLAIRDWRLLDRATSDAIRALWGDARPGVAEFDGWWRAGWVPILERRDGDLLVVDLEGTFDAPGSVVEVVHDAPIRYVRAVSLAAWLGALVDSLEAGGESLGVDVPSPSPYPREIRLGREHEAAAPSPTTPAAWAEAWRAHLVAVAPEARWAPLPQGWCALRWRCGADLDETLALVDDAPPTRRATELALLSRALHDAADARAEAVAARTLPSPAPALAQAALLLDLSPPTLRARLVERAVAQAAACVEGAALLCAAVAAGVAAHDVDAARRLLWWYGRMVPTPDTRFAATVARALAAARAGDPGAEALVRAFQTDPRAPPPALRDASLLRASILAAHAVGQRGDAVVEAMQPTSAAALVALRALVEAGDRASARALVDAASAPEWRVALGLCLANALPEGDAEGARALAEALALGVSPDDVLAILDTDGGEALAELRLDRALLDLRAGERARALGPLDAWREAARAHVAGLAAARRDGLEDDLARADALYHAVKRADLEAATKAWPPSQRRDAVVQRLLRGAAGLADGEEAAFGRALLEQVEAALRADRSYPGRFADALALALARHGRVDDALVIARAPWWFSMPWPFVALVARLVRLGRTEDACSLGAHLTRGRDLSQTLEVAAAIALVAPASLGDLREALDALGGARPSAASQPS